MIVSVYIFVVVLFIVPDIVVLVRDVIYGSEVMEVVHFGSDGIVRGIVIVFCCSAPAGTLTDRVLPVLPVDVDYIWYFSVLFASLFGIFLLVHLFAVAITFCRVVVVALLPDCYFTCSGLFLLC